MISILLALLLLTQQSFSRPPIKFLREKVVPQPQITKVHVIFMNHLDVGYSDYLGHLAGYSANVINTYFHTHFPTAIKLARQMRADGYVEQFRYTTHPWLLSFYLECPPNTVLANILIQCPSASDLQDMLQAIKDKDVVWHDGPMNMNFENMNEFGLLVSLNISANLNLRFGIKKPMRVVSFRDVPGITRGVIRHLLANNVVGITSGVNSGSAPPAVPPLNRWRAAARSAGEANIPEIVFMQNPESYPDPPGPTPNNPGGIATNHCHQAPGSTESLCFFFRVDNMGPPQSIEEVLSAYEILRAEYPNAKLVASTLEEFFTIAWNNRHLLPLVDQEMGDTWIQGTASDPKKFARYRTMQREFENYYKLGGPVTANVVDASRFLIKPSEHTYGLSSCGDTLNWRNDQFAKIRSYPNMLAEELSWVEQRQYEQLVLDILGPKHPLTISILKAFRDMETIDEYGDGTLQLIHKRAESDAVPPKKSFNFTCSNASHSVVVGFENEAISYLLAENLLISPDNPLGKLIYRTYNETDTEFFLRYYKTYWNTGYGKPNSTLNAHPESKEWNISLKSFYRKVTSACGFLIVVSAENPLATSYYGFPEEVFVEWDIDIKSGEISTQVFWNAKNPTRLMEAISFSFNPHVTNNAHQWYFSKIGEPISPYSVMLNGSQWQHTVDDNGVFIASSPNGSPIFRVIPWDTGVTCPITAEYGPTVWPAPLYPITKPITGVAFNFYNNVWNTNYIYWYPYNGQGTEKDSTFKARFTAKLSLIVRQIDDTLRYDGQGIMA